MLPAAAAAAMKYTLSLYAGQVNWFAPGFSNKLLACQLRPMSGLLLLDVYEYITKDYFPGKWPQTIFFGVHTYL